jgi:hypothetical protein
MNGYDTNEPENLIVAAIDAAEDIRDSLEGLVERTATNPGAPFALETLVRLVALKTGDFGIALRGSSSLRQCA